MDKVQLRQLVAELLAEMENEKKPEMAQSTEEEITDLSRLDLRLAYHVVNPENGPLFCSLKKKTPARLGLGRAGARYRTQSLLRFRADHAAAQDSVFSPVDPSFWETNGLTFVQTMCSEKEQYLTRPDLGRKFDEENQQIIRNTLGSKPEVVLLVGDGLSSDAVTTNAVDCMKAIAEGLKLYGHKSGQPLFIRYARVGAMDHIGALTDAQVICMLVGERPGLATSESMSAYITYRPYPGIPESKRTVVSNIHRNGTPAVEAGAYIAELLHTILHKQASGIDLR